MDIVGALSFLKWRFRKDGKVMPYECLINLPIELTSHLVAQKHASDHPNIYPSMDKMENCNT